MISLTTKVIVLAGCLFFAGCEDSAVVYDKGTTRFVHHNGGMWMYKDGKKYNVIIGNDYVIFEEE